MTPRGRAVSVVLTVAVAVTLVALGLHWMSGGGGSDFGTPAPYCSAEGTGYSLDPDQAANAATVAAVAATRRLPDRAVAIALTAALQESKLRNLPYGDRDSVGLFQQRPSQGWGPADRLVDPTYASGRFFDVLLTVRSWRTAPMSDVAQIVQRSGYPDAYAQWEATATPLAAAVTGSRPAGLTCSYPAPSAVPGAAPAAARALRAALPVQVAANPAVVDTAVASPAGGWRAATWLVAHGRALHLVSVSFAGRRWERGDHWRTDPSAPAGRVRATVVATTR